MIRYLWLSALLLLLAACSDVVEFPPELPDAFGDFPVDGGRTQAISVNPVNIDHVVIATEFGGLWKTDDRGNRWHHLDNLPAVFVKDVQYGADGQTLIATLLRDNRVDNGGGIWISRDEGVNWSRPDTGKIPGDRLHPDSRRGASGISLAPDDNNRWYVATDSGVARSIDNGVTWTHITVSDGVLGPFSTGLPIIAVQAFAGRKVLAMARSAIYRSDDGGDTWRNIRKGNYKLDEGTAFNKMDKVFNSPAALVVENYSSLWLYELDVDRWTAVPVPATSSTSRGPFVRVARASPGRSLMTIWVGQATRTVFTVVNSVAAIRSVKTEDWATLDRSNGIHDDTGDLGVSADYEPVMLGSDGGVFKPSSADYTHWVNAAAAGSGMNSYQITDLGGTNVNDPDTGMRTSLYFSTQDNAVWGSPDGGLSWPNYDCCEGFHVEVRHEAEVADKITAAYGTVGGHDDGEDSKRFSDADLVNSRAVPSNDRFGAAVTNMADAFYVSPRNWMRLRAVPGFSPEVWVSEDDGDLWRKRFILSVAPAGVYQRSHVSGRVSYMTGYLPVQTGEKNPDTSARIGIVKMYNLMADETDTLADTDVIKLPSSGSLGVRATQFDWQAVLGVDPNNWQFIIAPDVVNKIVQVSRDGGLSWTTDTALTNAVTKSGTLLFYDADAYHMQVTHIAFDPYHNRIMVGTRDAGIVCSADGGSSWQSIAGSERILYITGFQFQTNGNVVVSSYGRGLWKVMPSNGTCVPPATAGSTSSLASSKLMLTPMANTEPGKPSGVDNPELPRLLISSEKLISGNSLLGKSNQLTVRGRGFGRETVSVDVLVDDVLLPQRLYARPGTDGYFTLQVQVPDDLDKGMHTLEVRSSDQQKSARSVFIKAYRDEMDEQEH